MVNNSLFIEKEIPKLHPQSQEYIKYWKEQKKFCIEGKWIGGRWMPPNLYFYINHGTILLNKNKYAKAKTPGRPLLWDIHWEFFYAWSACRGLTGFDKQPEVQELIHHIQSNSEDYSKELEIRSRIKDVREVLKNSTADLGKPVYLNEAKNLMMLGSRDFGKSYSVANGVILHEFLFDGLKEYTEDSIKNPPSVEILVGAGDGKYSSDLLRKVKLASDSLPGGVDINNLWYPPPFSKKTTGAFSKEVMHLYRKKIGGTWIDKGTKSIIRHRTFADNPFAAQGTRNSIMVMEEIGMFDNLKESMEASVDTMKDSGHKFGSAILLGTGGDMASGTIDASEMFYDPHTYEMLDFEDTWENKGKICYFVPDYLANRHFKDSEGNSDINAAKDYEEKEREKIRKGKNASTALDAHIQYHPIIPSEIFLSKSGNIFPKKELQSWLSILESNPLYENVENIGYLIQEDDGIVRWKPDLTRELKPITKFPLDTKKDDIEGCLVIWEHPHINDDGVVPSNLYIAGTDPYDHDEAGVPSLGSTFIYKRYYNNQSWYELPVAEYTGRPKANEYYRTLGLLLKYYNALCLYENEKKGVHQYFESKNIDYLLMDQPGYIRDVVPNSTVQRVKGMHMSQPLKVHGETLIKNWLEEEFAPGKLNLTKIRSKPLLKELIMYNTKGNFDRVMAFLLTMYALQEKSKTVVREKPKVKNFYNSDFFDRRHFTNNNKMMSQEMINSIKGSN